MTEQEKETLDHPQDAPVEEQVETADLAEELADAQARIQNLEDQLLRRTAEFQNYRRRVQQDLAQAGRRGQAELALAVVDVLDDLRRSHEAAAAADLDDAQYQSLKEGVDLVYRKFEDSLAKFDVRAIDAVGQPFDENLHEALMQSPADDVEPGTVTAEIQKGYVMGERVLRHAKVTVAQ